jgi:hypothetical protein
MNLGGQVLEIRAAPGHSFVLWVYMHFAFTCGNKFARGVLQDSWDGNVGTLATKIEN